MRIQEILLKMDCESRGYSKKVGCLRSEASTIRRFTEPYRERIWSMRGGL